MSGARPFHVMVKPVGDACNLDCRYCFYKDKSEKSAAVMDDRTLETFIEGYIAAQTTQEINFAWQGGEPLLAGRAFYEKVLKLQRRHNPAGKAIVNAIQTNGTLLDDDWCAFLRDNGFLVGLSIDGRQSHHDRFRVDKSGRPTFGAVRQKLNLLQRLGVEFNTLTVVHKSNARFGKEIYRFLRTEGVRYMQFIPLVERFDQSGGLIPPPAPGDTATEPANLAPWSVPPAGYGTFLCSVFDEWVKRDVGRIYVQSFDVHLGLWSGMPSDICVFAQECGANLALEQNGDFYSCDHYVFDAYRLGNLTDKSPREIAGSDAQGRFGEAKRSETPLGCNSCPYLFACNAGCPKHRFVPAGDGPDENYLCPSYQRYFRHVAPTMEKMADLLRSGRPPALIMENV